MGQVKGNMKEFKTIIDELDLNKNGFIDYSEFLNAACNKQEVITNNNLRLVFEMIDIDKSGYITIDELKVAFKQDNNSDYKIYA